MLVSILRHTNEQLGARIVKFIKPPHQPTGLGLPPDGDHIHRDTAQYEDETHAHLPRTHVARERDQEGADDEKDDGEDDTHSDGALHVGALVTQPEQAGDAYGGEEGLHEGDVVD